MSIASISCPKCGFEQDGGTECQSCGIVFSRYKPAPLSIPQPLQFLPDAAPVVPTRSLLRQSVRVLVWAILPLGAAMIISVMSHEPSPSVRSDPNAAQRVASKIQRLEYASDVGRPMMLEFDEAEVNAWMRAVFVHDAVEGRGRDSLRDLKIQLLEDRLRAYLMLHYYGTDLSLILEGQLRVVDDHLRFEPTSGKLGSLPLPQSFLNRAVRRVIDAPENQEKLGLPMGIAKIVVRRGELMFSSFH